MDHKILGTEEKTLDFAANQWVQLAKEAIEARGAFCVALSGGSTPKKIYQRLANQPIDWSRVWLFWGDERCVPLDHPDSNYKMAMDSGFSDLPIPKAQIFPFISKGSWEEQADRYEAIIQTHVPEGKFDLVMLGMGEDGHTASLFPGTAALQEGERWAVANDVPGKGMRLTLTYPVLNRSRQVVFYALGQSKAEKVSEIAQGADYPATHVQGALWILDDAAASGLDQRSGV